MTPWELRNLGLRDEVIRLKLVALVAAVCIAVVLAPLSRSPWLYLAFSLSCHQQPERSLWVSGMPLAICARCTGIYLGVLVGLLKKLPSRRALLLAALGLILLDWASEALGLRPAWALPRFLTGGLAGLAASPVVLEAGTVLLRPPYWLKYRTVEGNKS